jgi:CBS domain-containing protein
MLLMGLFYFYLASIDIKLKSKSFLTHFKIAYKKLIGKKKVATVGADTDLKEIFGIMHNWNGNPIGSVLVVDDAQKPIGIITYEDIRRELHKNPENFPKSSAAKIMTKDLFTFHLNEIKTPVEFKKRLHAAKLLGINHIIVLDEDNMLKDIFTTKDIFRTMEPGYGILRS